MQNTSFPSISRFFKSLTEVEGKIREIESNNATLEALIDNKVVESIQEAVDQRMGPYMCDNSLEESKAEQTDFLNILKGFKKAADEKRVNESMLLGKTQKQNSLQIEHCVSGAQSCLDSLLKKTDVIDQMSNNLSRYPLASSLKAIQDDNIHQIEGRIRQMEVELEVALLEQQLNAVGIFDQLKTLLSSF